MTCDDKSTVIVAVGVEYPTKRSLMTKITKLARDAGMSRAEAIRRHEDGTLDHDGRFCVTVLRMYLFIAGFDEGSKRVGK